MKKITLGFIFTAILTISTLSLMPNKQSNTPSLNKWQLIWSDEFEGTELNTDYWNRQVEKAGRFNEEWQRYTDSEANAYLENNCLVIEAIHHGEQHGMDAYSSARINTAGKFTFKYGKISARIKLPYSMGIWPAFWMLGANIDENGGDTPWPLCGEIDILELYGSKNDAVVEANIHYADASGQHAMMGSESFELERGIFADDFHLFELEWTPETISWSVDGKTYASTSINTQEFSEFHEEFFLLLNIAVGGTFAGRPDKSSVFPQKMYVDWIRVYQRLE